MYFSVLCALFARTTVLKEFLYSLVFPSASNNHERTPWEFQYCAVLFSAAPCLQFYPPGNFHTCTGAYQFESHSNKLNLKQTGDEFLGKKIFCLKEIEQKSNLYSENLKYFAIEI